MKILLAAINAKYIHTNPAVRCLKAYAEKQTGIFVDFSEYTINQRTDCILSDIYRKKPDVLGFSCYIWNMEMVEKLVGSLRLLLPDTLIFLGGPEVSFDADQLLRKLPAADCILCGDAGSVAGRGPLLARRPGNSPESAGKTGSSGGDSLLLYGP